MRIEALRSETRGDRHRVVATVVWEDCDREPQDIFYETTSDFADALTCDPHAFLIGAILPALQRGEQRIAIDAPICPKFRNGVLTALGWFQEWGYFDRTICIESSAKARLPQTRPPRAASFLSGGADSLSVLRANRLDYPLDHPRAIKDCFFVHGFDIGALVGHDLEIAFYEFALHAGAAVAADAGVTLIPVYTNIRHLQDDMHFWIFQFHGAALASVAHAFSNRITSASIASGFDISNLVLASTHPLIEPNYSSANLRIRHEGILHTRLDKVRMLSDWPVALENMRVCTMNPPGKLNCGECEKCLRTMLQLLSCDCLDKAITFPYRDVTPEMLERIYLKEKYQDGWYEELVSPLTAIGRLDLVAVIERKRHEFQKRLAWEEERDWKGAVKRFDRKWLGSSLYKSYCKYLELRRG